MIDLKRAREVLDRDHYGLDKVKERIIQHLAVMKLTDKKRGTILLFEGLPERVKQASARVLPKPSEENT